MKDILLIGASGFVGTRLIENIGAEEVHNVDKKQSDTYPEITRIHNICDPGLEMVIPKNTKTVVLLAAEHRDDVFPTSRYYDVNVQGTQNVLDAMDKLGIQKIIFTSSVAVYGLNKTDPDENTLPDPFNHYGKSKWQAEEALRKWYGKDPANRSLTIIRPTVIFGERNRGNVYNLLQQIASGKFILVGNGKNKKSMAYVGNVVSFIERCIQVNGPGYFVFNYVDKPDLTTSELISHVEETLHKNIPAIRLPYWVGMMGGYVFDGMAKITGKKFPISSVRVKKFCATTQFNASKAHQSGFMAPYSLQEGLNRTVMFEFVNDTKDGTVFYSE